MCVCVSVCVKVCVCVCSCACGFVYMFICGSDFIFRVFSVIDFNYCCLTYIRRCWASLEVFNPSALHILLDRLSVSYTPASYRMNNTNRQQHNRNSSAQLQGLYTKGISFEGGAFVWSVWVCLKCLGLHHDTHGFVK